MSTTTDNIGLVKPDYLEQADIAVLNDNSDVIDAQIKALTDVVANAKALLGQLGVDEDGNPLVSASSARATLDAAQDDGSGTTLYAAQQAIAANAADIATLRDSVSWSDGSAGVYARKAGRLVAVMVNPGHATEIGGRGTGVALTTLPEAYRPASLEVGACDANGDTVHIMVQPTGSVSIYNGGDAGTTAWLRGSVAYVSRG